MESKEKDKFYATLCNNHNQIIHNLTEIKKLTKDEHIKAIAKETIEYSRYCKKQGQRMENRLSRHSMLSAGSLVSCLLFGGFYGRLRSMERRSG